MASIKQRTANSFQLIVSCGYDSNGKKLTKSKTVTLLDGMTERQREKELNRLAVLFEKQVQDGSYLDGERLTFGEFVKKWMVDYAEKRLAPGTLNPYRTRLDKRIIPAIGHIKLAKLQPHHLMEFYNNLSEGEIRLDTRYTPSEALCKALEPLAIPVLVKLSGLSYKTCQRIKNGSQTTREAAQKLTAALDGDIKKLFVAGDDKRLSDKTIRNHHGLVSTILSAAVRWNLIRSNPAERVDLGKMAKYKPCYYDDEQIAQMLSKLDVEPLRFRAMIYLTIDTGMRTGELTGLMWADLDLDKAIVTVNKQRQYVSGSGTIIRGPKTESGNRPITLSGTVAALLRQYKTAQMEDLLSLGITWNEDLNVFLHEDGKAVHPQLPYKQFTEFLKRHDLPAITFHALRHTNASLLISAGVDVVTLSGRLGHADRTVTLNTYSHIIKNKEEQAANRMDMFYTRVGEKAKSQAK